MLSAKMVKKLYGGAAATTPAVGIAESLSDALKDKDHAPKVATLQDGGVVSLREKLAEPDDDTLEFYGVVPKMADLTQSEGMLNCGTDTKVGDAAFLKAFNDQPALALDAVKKGAAAIFAVRVAPKTTTVEVKKGSSSSA